MVSDTQLRTLGNHIWADIRNRYPRSNDAIKRRQLAYVGERIATASGLDEDWEFEVFEGPVNAFVLPGGKVGFYTGIYQFIQNEAQLAAVIGHEAGHVAAKHSAERLSQQMLASIVVGAITSVIAGQTTSRAELQAVAGLLGAGVTYGILLPYSREHEHEADHLGGRFMASAGYDPGESAALWKGFTSSASRGRQLEFLSTHPTDDARVARIESSLPELARVYERAPRAAAMPADWVGNPQRTNTSDRILCRLGNARPVRISAMACRSNDGVVF